MSTLKKMTAAVLALLVMAVAFGLVASPNADAKPAQFQIVQTPGGGGNNAQCPAGSVEDMNGQCRVPVADAVQCPKGTLGVPWACYIFVDKVKSRVGADTCPVGSFEDDRGNCRQPVAHEVVCPKFALGVPGACYIVVPKVMPKVLKAG